MKIKQQTTAACPACKNTCSHQIVRVEKRLYECNKCGHFSTQSELEASEHKINPASKRKV